VRILLDENVPRKLKHRFAPDHEATTVQECGWSGIHNGALLAKAELEFEVFLTLDRNMEFQQDISGKRLSVIVLKSRSSAY
jgi:predicted nuclease of predicted toxin-antitoxin system